MEAQSLVLIVDDEPVGRKALESALVSEGYRLAFASSGSEALTRLGCAGGARELDPDVVLLDVMMPGLDGIEVLTRLRADPACRELPILLITALDDRASRLAGLEAGADDYLGKPLDRAEVRARVRTVTRLNRYRRLQTQAALLDLASDAIIARDMDGRVVFWNAGAERVYGYSAAEAVGRSVAELLREPGPARWTRLAGRGHPGAFDHQGVVGLLREGESRQVRRDGREIIVRSHKTQVQDAGGQPTQELIVATDVTEQKRLEWTYYRAQRMESLGALAGGIAHDLNNVLTPLLMGIDWLQHELENATQLSLLRTMKVSVDRGTDLIAQILSFTRGAGLGSRPGRGRRVGGREGVSVKTIFRDIQRLVTSSFPRAIEARYQIPADIWPILGDATQIHQILLNLAVNARDAMPEGGVLTFTAENLPAVCLPITGLSAAPRPAVRLRVRDSGTGISPEDRPHLFDPFFTTKEPGKGTGLGLATVARIVADHGGLIGVTSEPPTKSGPASRVTPGGAEFTVTLPAATALVAALIEDEDAPPEGSPPVGEGEGLLIVDDDSSIRELARALLEGFGYRVWTADDARGAEDLMRARLTDIALVLLSAGGGECEATAALRALRQINPGIKVLLGASVTPSTRRDADLASLPLVTKPYTTGGLLAAVRRVLDGWAGPVGRASH